MEDPSTTGRPGDREALGVKPRRGRATSPARTRQVILHRRLTKGCACLRRFMSVSVRPGRYGFGAHPGRDVLDAGARSGERRRGRHRPLDEGPEGRRVEEGELLQVRSGGPQPLRLLGADALLVQEGRQEAPRTAQQQYNKTRHIAKSQRKRGDLVFFHSGRSVYHVGIYAGAGKIWHSQIGGRGATGENLVQERLVRTGPLTHRPDALSLVAPPAAFPCGTSPAAFPRGTVPAASSCGHRPCRAVTGLSAAAGR